MGRKSFASKARIRNFPKKSKTALQAIHDNSDSEFLPHAGDEALLDSENDVQAIFLAMEEQGEVPEMESDSKGDSDSDDDIDEEGEAEVHNDAALLQFAAKLQRAHDVAAAAE
ncbi:hypothetical protein K439DRAFT_1615283 [Ramaria rubella]|nr:hypothetical protein K439DRAFT_1615283 [Ramaria rubella]